MARARSDKRDKAYQMWLDSDRKMMLKDIATELGVSETQIRKWKSLDKWEHVKKEQKPINRKGTLPKSKSNVTNDVSWVDIEKEYVSDIRKKPCTLENLSKKYNIPTGTIEKYSMDHSWSDKRKKYRETVKQKTVDKTAEIISNEISKVTSRHFRISDKLLDSIEKAIGDENELYTYVEKLRTGYGPGDFTEKIVTEVLDSLNDAKLLNMVNSLDKLQKLQRQTLGIIDGKDKEKLQIERERLEIEKIKVNIGDPDGSSGVQIIDDIGSEFK